MNQWRCWSLFLGLSFGSAACTKENPAYHCQNSTCIDPAFPYCDADGSIGGTAGVCIAVTCTAGEFGKCSGDSALTCNDTGTGYVETQCAHGCDEGTGCKLCEANQTVCENGVVASCDANGAQTATENCPLGCFEDQPRCRDIDPANHLGTYMDMNKTPPDLDLSTGDWYVLNDAAGTISGPQSATVVVPNYVVNQPGGGPRIHVYVVNSLKLGSVYIAGPAPISESQATVFLASGDVNISGPVRLDYHAGGYADRTCAGAQGFSTFAQSNGAIQGYGPGGGGAVAAGAHGGIVDDGLAGAARLGGAPFGVDSLEPLVGGCYGGGYDNSANGGDVYEYGAGGGGALQITSRKSITIAGRVSSDGSDGTAGGQGPGTTTTFGGGGGGSILLEAPIVTLAANSMLSAAGGRGFGCDPPNEFCGGRGQGGTATAAPTPGGNLQFVIAAGANAEFYAGGGGGSVGRIRVNTPTSTYSADSSATLNASVTTGTVKTR